MAPGSMPNLARPIRGVLCTTPGYACAPGTLCASQHNTVPARSLSLPGKHGELAQVSYLPSPHSRVPPPQYIFGLPATLPCCILIPPPLSFGCLQLCLGAAIFPSLCPGSFAVQDLLPCPGVLRSLLLLPVTTLLGPLVVGDAVTVIDGGRR